MYKELWKKTQQAVCQISFYDANNIKIGSLSGFKTSDFIVTDEMVLKYPRAFEAEFLFVEADAHTPFKKLRMPVSEFRKRILPRAKSIYNHLVFIQASFPVIQDIKGLSLSCGMTEPGQPVAVLGFHLDHSNLSIKPGILSSVCTFHGRPYLQFEVSVKQGNSGSPLLNAETGEVIGVVGYRLAEMTKTFLRIRDVVDQNVEVLEMALNKWKIDDIDPVQVLIANQKLIKHFANEIYKSANIRIGFATPVSEIQNYLKVNHNAKVLITNQKQ